MTRVKVDPAAETQPEAAPAKVVKKVVEVTDALGRRLKVRRLSALHKVDLSMIVGADGVKNEAVIGPCALAFSVTEIDGEAIFPPNNYAELRVLIGRLDDEGLEAAGQAAVEHFGIVAEPMTADELGNS